MHLLPYAPRACACTLANAFRLTMQRAFHAPPRRGGSYRPAPVNTALFLPVLTAHLSEARLTHFLSDLRRVADEAARAWPPPSWLRPS